MEEKTKAMEKPKAKRGDQLREHMLRVAKDVFLEFGFERTSMDLVAVRAQASKRSLYAHFENKEKLFLAVIEMVRGLFLARLKLPADYSDKPKEALTLFCGRYLEILLYEPSVRMMRISMAEAERFPEQAQQYFDALFLEVPARLAAYVKETFNLPAAASSEAAHRLLALVQYPRMPRALFGIDAALEAFGEDAPAVDLKPIRKTVGEWMEGLPKR